MNWKAALLVSFLLVAPALPESTSDTRARQLFQAINRLRAQRGVAPLRWDAPLAEAAQSHTVDMAQHQFFDHDSPLPGRETIEKRVAQAGGDTQALAENIHWSSGKADSALVQATIDDWLTSQDHQEAIYNPAYRLTGIGTYRKGKEFWATQIFSE